MKPPNLEDKVLDMLERMSKTQEMIAKRLVATEKRISFLEQITHAEALKVREEGE